VLQAGHGGGFQPTPTSFSNLQVLKTSYKEGR
jgi:hypothetical protein